MAARIEDYALIGDTWKPPALVDKSGLHRLDVLARFFVGRVLCRVCWEQKKTAAGRSRRPKATSRQSGDTAITR